jgi:cell shape-determining protein MreD
MILALAFVAVYWEAAFTGLRQLLGAQVDVLPSLMVYAALRTSLGTVCMLALLGGLCFDSLSANPLGVTVLPQFAIGFLIYLMRDIILRDQLFAQWTLGLVAGASAPVLTLVLLLTIGHPPLLGWGTIWQIIVMTAGGAIATPVCFVALEWLHRALFHSPINQSSFRPDREIRRGR